MRLTKPYEEYLIESLKDPEEAATYLETALEEEDEAAFLLALRQVAEAQGMTILSQKAKLNRESLYKMLSKQGNPKLSSLVALLNRMGLRLSVQVQH